MDTTAELIENSHQGFEGIKAGLCLASMESKSNDASGMPVCLWQNGIRSRSSGKERDNETGLDYFGFRYYSGAQGRWTSPDAPFADQHPEDPQSWSMYGYVRNNPLLYVDPNGYQAREALMQIQQIAPSIPYCGPIIGGAATGLLIITNWDNIKTAGEWLLEHGPRYTSDETIGGAARELYNAGILKNGIANTQNRSTGNQESATGDPNQQPSKKDDGPNLVSNPKHNQNSASPEPQNAQELFKNSVVDKNNVRWAKDADGTIHRFSKPSNGESHWNGSTAGPKPIKMNNIPNDILKVLE
jgi:RHS repeat-associated protein